MEGWEGGMGGEGGVGGEGGMGMRKGREGGRVRNRGRNSPPKKQNHFLCKLNCLLTLLLPRETST